jgi:TPP-dependent pyruvate/acetoin dehydrogenase alpha subunit
MSEKTKWTKETLRKFEDEVAAEYEQGEIPFPIHFNYGCEEHLLKIFEQINDDDWVFGTHRAHYMALLKGMDPNKLKEVIRRGDSMHVYDKSRNIYTSSIVAGHVPVAVGVAKAIKMTGGRNKVWVFCGDGSTDEPHFWSALRYVRNWDLPAVFVVENNNLSVDTPISERYRQLDFTPDKHLIIVNYTRETPHVGTGKFIKINKQKDAGQGAIQVKYM